MIKIEPKAEAEWLDLKDILLCHPGNLPYYGSLDPFKNLYAPGPMNLTKVAKEYEALVDTIEKVIIDPIKEERIRVHYLKDLVTDNPKSIEIVRDRWVDMYRKLYYNDPEYYNNSDYKHRNPIEDAQLLVSGFGKEHIWTDLIQKPEIVGSRESPNRNEEGRVPITQLAPMPCNLYYMRDQQFVTDLGLVMGRMRKSARYLEPKITKLGFETLGIKPIFEVDTPFEGGDFMPAGDIAFIGIGNRTKFESAKSVIDNAVDFEEVAVVYQPNAKKTMHLDTYFNIFNEGECLGENEILRNGTKVILFRKQDDGTYEMVSSGGSLAEYLAKKEFNVFDITPDERNCYCSNILTLGPGKIIAPTMDKSDYIKRLENLGLDVIPLDVHQLTQGDGGIHCLTSVLRRG